jgi:ATPase subunit of ABC transporter with duplicated ATPase domains
VNGAGKTTQLQIVMGRLTPDTGEVIKAKRNMKVAYLAQVGLGFGVQGKQLGLWA